MSRRRTSCSGLSALHPARLFAVQAIHRARNRARPQVAFGGRYAASISTSINFYDTTAHNYIQAVSEDLGMQFAGLYSANMNDLRSPTEQERLTGYFMDLEATVAGRLAIPRRYAPLPPESGLSLAGVADSAELEPRGRNPAAPAPIGKRLLILTDEAHAAGPQPLQRLANLRAMTSRLARAWAGQPRAVDLADVGMRGGCLGCLECGQEFRCRYEGKDGFTEFFRNDIFGHLRIVFPADHKAYRERGYYDFPTRKPIRRLAIAALSAVLKLPFVRKEFVKGIKGSMAGRFRGVLAVAPVGTIVLRSLSADPDQCHR